MSVLDRILNRGTDRSAEPRDRFTCRVERMSYKGGWKPIEVGVELSTNTPDDLIQFNYVDDEPPGRFRLVELDAEGGYRQTIWTFETFGAEEYYRSQREPPAHPTETGQQEDQAEADPAPESVEETSGSEPDPEDETRALVLKGIADNQENYSPEVKEQLLCKLLGIEPDDK